MPTDPRPGDSHPTWHALRVFGGALGMVLMVAGICIFAAQIGGDGCSRCRATALGACVAIVIGLVLVRSAWRAMRANPRPR